MRKCLKILLILFAVAGAMMILWWTHRPPEKRLLKLATKVANINTAGAFPHLNYVWLTDHELLISRPMAGQWQVSRHDIAAHNERPLPVLTMLFNRTKGDPGSIKPSPDGKWLLWAGSGKFIYAATSKGTSFRRWCYGREETYPAMWLADSRHFVHFTLHRSAGYPDMTKALVRDVSRSAFLKRLPMTINAPKVSTDVFTSLRPNSRIYAEPSTDSPGNGFVRAYFLNVNKAEEEWWEVPMPSDSMTLDDPVSSPFRFHSEGRRVLWKLSTERKPKPLAWVKRLYGFFHIPLRSRLTGGVWVSGLDGTGMHEIGNWAEDHVPDSGSDLDMEIKPYNFRWVPGGKRLSFEYRGALYTVSAE